MSGTIQHRPELWLDTSTPEPNLALLRDGQILTEPTCQGNALDVLFTALDTSLHEQGIAFDDLTTLHYCGGPGSSLGLRIAAMALRIWKALRPDLRLRTCSSLALQAALLTEEPDAPPHFILVAQHRKGIWYKVEHHTGHPRQSEPEAMGEDDIPELRGTLFHMQQRKFATPLPPHFLPMPLHTKNLPAVLHIDGLFREVEHPEFFDPGTPSFQKWQPRRHKSSQHR